MTEAGREQIRVQPFMSNASGPFGMIEFSMNATHETG